MTDTSANVDAEPIPRSREPLATFIQAHPDRADLATELAEVCLAGAAEIVYDPEPLSPLRSPWRTYRACLERGLAAGTDSILVIQDDVIVCANLLEAAARAALARPGSPIALFVPGKPALYVRTIGAARTADEPVCELPLGTWVPTVATLWPAALAEQILDWYDGSRLPRGMVADDEIVGRFLNHVRIPALASVPSLVEHPDTVPSVMNGRRRVGDGRDPGRRAEFWIGDEPDRYGCDGLVWANGL